MRIIATWNTARDAWETPGAESLFCGHLAVYSETLPTSGMTRNGVLFGRPTWAHLMPGHGSSSSPEGALFPTPRTSDTNGPGLHGCGGMDLRTAVTLLPTPTAMDSKASGGAVGSPNVTLTDAVIRGRGASVILLQTPSVADADGTHERRGGARSGELLLKGQAKELATGWGEYEPAVRQWESILGRPSPDPVEPNTRGGVRLSARFDEWLMGVPEGWITGIPISRNEQLKACGNGVVPQQAAAALKDMLAAFGMREDTAA